MSFHTPGSLIDQSMSDKRSSSFIIMEIMFWTISLQISKNCKFHSTSVTKQAHRNCELSYTAVGKVN